MFVERERGRGFLGGWKREKEGRARVKKIMIELFAGAVIIGRGGVV